MTSIRQQALVRAVAAAVGAVAFLAGGVHTATAAAQAASPANVAPLQATGQCVQVTGMLAESGGIRFNTSPDPGCPGVGFRSGATVSMTARPDVGATFSGWSGTFAGTVNPLVFVITSDVSVSATFQKPVSAPAAPASVGVGSASLSVSPSVIDFGPDVTTAIVRLTNGGGGPLEWSVVAGSVPPWARVYGPPSSSAAYFTVEVNRSAVAPGRYSAGLTVTSNAGARVVTIAMSAEMVVGEARPATAPVPVAGASGLPRVPVAGIASRSLADPGTPTAPSVPVTPAASISPASTAVSRPSATITLSASEPAAGAGDRVTLTARIVDGVEAARSAFVIFGIRIEDETGGAVDWCDTPSAEGVLTCTVSAMDESAVSHTYVARAMGTYRDDTLWSQFMVVGFHEFGTSEPVTVDWLDAKRLAARNALAAKAS